MNSTSSLTLRAFRKQSWCGLTALSLIAGACTQETAVVAPKGVGVEPIQVENTLCATADEAAKIAEYYSETRPGAVLPIPGRLFKLPESKIVSGLDVSQAVGVDATPELLAEIWSSIDAWGADTPVSFVVSIDGWHPFDFPGKVPVTQESHNPGFYDVYADGGDGVHVHLNPDEVKLIYAAQTAATDGTKSRSVNLYGPSGRLILGLYASKAGKPENEAAISGFNGTWDLIESMPRSCAGKNSEN